MASVLGELLLSEENRRRFGKIAREEGRPLRRQVREKKGHVLFVFLFGKPGGQPRRGKPEGPARRFHKGNPLNIVRRRRENRCAIRTGDASGSPWEESDFSSFDA
jgi:hypothetical protein